MVTAADGPRTAPLAPLVAVAAGIVVVAASAGVLLAVVRPDAVLAAVAAIAATAAMVSRIRWATLCYVAVEPFGDLLGTVHPAAVKGIGALLFAAWLLRLALDNRPLGLRRPGAYAAGALGIAVLVSLVLSGTDARGVEIAVRYLSYVAVLAVVVDTLRETEPDRLRFARRIASVFVVSCAASGALGLTTFLHEGGRAAGPLADPNDFGFFLISAVPFALWLGRTPGPLGRLYGCCAVVLVLTTLATLSRGALVGLAAIVLVGLALRLLRLRHLVLGLAAVAVALVAATAFVPDLVDRSLEEKQHVAASNVDSRFTTWSTAAAMTADAPLFGHGPGSFATEGARYLTTATADTTSYDVAHQMYLDVASELGLVGLGAFLAVIGYGVLGAARARRDPASEPTATAVLTALAGVLVAATFLSEQYYLPVWLLAGLGIALDPARLPGSRGDGRPHPIEEGELTCASSS